ncbi:MAG: beta-lactamase family protein [Candidatus Aminicenantes bacterium]|nr:MAG: beta-lactamase family protein [Candidatus Aminicenantes bacterium]
MEAFIQSLIEKEVFPGISILIGKRENILFKRCRGWKSLLPQRETLAEHTLYDLASLTKPLVTAFLLVYLLEKEKVSLETNIRKIFPGLPSHFDITLIQLLTHTSGLPAWYPFYLFGSDYFSQFKSMPLESRPGKWVNYSCVGYILLYYLIEKVTGTTFKEFASQVIIEPLGLKHTFLAVPGDLKKNAAPTEEGNKYEKNMAEEWAKKNGKSPGYGDRLERVNRFKWRTAVIQGEPHDINSHILGGTAGNAGLFSTPEDVFRICLEFFPATASLLKTGSLQLFWKNFTPFNKSHRTVGFKRNSSFVTSGGRALSRKAIGHNGFTGTSLWLEPREETTFILLTNRIHPRVKAVNFDKIRRKLHRLLEKELATKIHRRELMQIKD